jgi:branched-chain amino acid transport system permease protein
MILGAYFTSLFVITVGLPFPVGVLAAMVAMAAVGAITERIAMRPLVGQPVFSAAMVTVGAFIVLTIVANRLIGPDILTVGDPWGLDAVSIGGVRSSRSTSRRRSCRSVRSPPSAAC